MSFIHLLLISLITVFSLFSFAEEGFVFKPYGRIKATTLYADKAVNSFDRVNASAPTAASITTGVTTGLSNTDNFWTFQVAQSRFGSDFEKGQVFGNLEFDFIDFGISSPTTEAKPRLRKAYAGYKINDHSQIQMGQDWDTFSPLAPNLLDYVGLHFNSGNAGFMRQQLKWRYNTDSIKTELSLGMPAKNPNAEYNYIENSTSPALAYMIDWQGLGASLFYATIKKPGFERKNIQALNLFYKGKLSDKINLITEAYWGQNMNDAALLTISHITAAGRDLKEMGGYINTTYDSETCGAWTLSYGLAKLINDQDAGTYTYDVAAKKISEDGILSNQLARIYWKMPIEGGLSFATEISYFNTKRNMGASLSQSTSTYSIESGLLLMF
jgi:hypothetical protein